MTEDEMATARDNILALTNLARTIATNGERIVLWSFDEQTGEITIRVHGVDSYPTDTWFELDGHRIAGRRVGIQIGREHDTAPQDAFLSLWPEGEDIPEDAGEYTFVPLNHLRALLDPREERDIYPHLLAAARLIHNIDEGLDIRIMLTDNHVDRSLEIPTILGINVPDSDQKLYGALDGQQVGPWTIDMSFGSFDNEHWNVWIFLRETKANK